MLLFTRKFTHCLKLGGETVLLTVILSGLATAACSAQDPAPALLDQAAQGANPGQQPPAQTPPAQSPPEPDRKPKRHLYVGPNFGVFLPASSKTRSRFGSAWLEYGVGLGRITVKPEGRWSPDLQFLSQSYHGNHLFFGLLGVEYRRPLLFRMPHSGEGGRKGSQMPGQPSSGEEGRSDEDGSPSEPGSRRAPQGWREPWFLPYLGFSADLAVGDLRDLGDNIHSGVRTGAVGSLFLGVNLGDRAFIEARYREMSAIKGFDLSGLVLRAGYRFRF